jgi:hypothetical protein
MDRRKIKVEKDRSFFEALNSDELNLELADNIESLFNLREIIKMKARQTFDENREKSRIFTFFKSHQSLEDNPKTIYVFSITLWALFYRVGAVSKVSLLFVIFGLNLWYNIKRQYYCKIQKEYTDYKRLNDNYHQIVKLKKKAMSMERFLERTMGADYNKYLDIPNHYLKYEYLY